MHASRTPSALAVMEDVWRRDASDNSIFFAILVTAGARLLLADFRRALMTSPSQPS